MSIFARLDENGVKIINTKIKKLQVSLEYKETSKAMVKGAQIIRKETVSALKKVVRVTGRSKSSIKYGRIERGVKIVNNKREKAVKVHIMGDFRLKYLELGTKRKKTTYNSLEGRSRRKKRNLVPVGRTLIKAKYFFRSVNENKSIQDRVYEVMREELEKIVKKYS